MSSERPEDAVKDGHLEVVPTADARDEAGTPASAQALASVFWQRTLQGARLMVGVPDYDAYVAHLRENHPDVRPLTREDFVRAAQNRRYGRGGGGRCC